MPLDMFDSAAGNMLFSSLTLCVCVLLSSTPTLRSAAPCRALLIPTQADRRTRMCPWRRRRRAAGRRGSSRPLSSWRGPRSVSQTVSLSVSLLGSQPASPSTPHLSAHYNKLVKFPTPSPFQTICS